MKYKGFIIESVPLLDYKPDPESRSGQWKTVKVGIEYYQILDPMEGEERWIADSTIEKCKSHIDRFLKNSGMKDNKPESWLKLDGCTMKELRRLYPRATLWDKSRAEDDKAQLV